MGAFSGFPSILKFASICVQACPAVFEYKWLNGGLLCYLGMEMIGYWNLDMLILALACSKMLLEQWVHFLGFRVSWNLHPFVSKRVRLFLSTNNQ